jgi:hypothetical protein
LLVSLKIQFGNMAFEQVVSITKQKMGGMLANNFLGALKSVLGSCMAMGILIDSKDPKIIIQEVKDGKYDKEIKSQKTDVSPEKAKELSKFFTELQGKQQEAKKKEEEAKAAEEAAKAAAATAKPAAGAAAPEVAAPAKGKDAKPAAKK